MLEPIDVGNIFPAEILDSLSDEMVERLVKDMAKLAFLKWKGLANQYCHSSHADYVAGIQKPDISGSGRQVTARVSLEGVFPNMIENGFDAYDMRDTLLGPNVPVASQRGQKGKRQAEDGHFYRSIPFRIGTSKSRGSSFQRAEDVYADLLGAEEAKKAGRRAMRRARKLKSTTVGGSGERLAEGQGPKLKEMHATDPFAGMYRFEEQYKEKTQFTYGTFRTISDTSDPAKWQHPGYDPGKQLAKKVSEYLGIQGPKLVITKMRF